MRRVCYIAVLTLCFTIALTSLPFLVQAQQSGDLEYTPEQIQSTSAELFLERMARPEPGYQTFAAMHALAKKAKDSDPMARGVILRMVVTAMNDRSRSEYQRFQCCYVISECGDERGVPYLINVLNTDPSVTMRSVAAEALAVFTNNAEAKEALVQAAGRETNEKVLEVINRRLAECDAEYTPEQIRSISAETFLERMAKPEPGYHRFSALWALGKKAKESDVNTRQSILSTVVKAMNDTSRTEYQRFQCCYVISDCGDAQWVPYLIDVLFSDPSVTMRSVAAEALGKFTSSIEAQDALYQASQQEKNQKVLDVINRCLNQGDAKYTKEQIQSISAETFLERLEKPEPGYHKFSALWALARKANESDLETRRSILTIVVKAMNDTSRMEYQRFQCCYVISDCGDEQWVPCLVDVLVKDSSATMRSVAAEALGKFRNCATAHDALVQALSREKNQRVLDVLNRVLGKTNSAS